MAYSYVNYTGDGTTNQYAITFPYISQAHVFLFVAGVSVPFTWINAGLIQATTTPEPLAFVLAQRVTPPGQIVVFTDGSTVPSSDLNTSDLQTIYLSQEAADAIGQKLGLNSTLVYDALGTRLTGLATPTAPSDAVTKAYVDTAVTSGISSPSFTSLIVTGSTSLGTLSVTGTLGAGSFSTAGNATVGGTLGVTGLSTHGSLVVTGNTTVNGTFTLSGTGTATFGGALAVTGNATIGGTLAVTGNITGPTQAT
eukprot:gene28687-32057_t